MEYENEINWIHYEVINDFILDLGYRVASESVFKDGRVLEWFIHIESKKDDVYTDIPVLNENTAYNAYNELKAVFKVK
jgi:hypothetical protein